MTLAQFWESDPSDLEIYKNAFNLRVEKEDRDAWYAGMYIHSAVASCLNKSNKYPTKPHKDGYYEDSKLTQEERDMREMRRQIAQMRIDAENQKARGMKRNFEEGDNNDNQSETE